LIRGEAGWDIIDELKPGEGELVVDKPTKGAFTTTDIDLVLRNRGITHLVFTGITTDVCVHTIMREANDLGYECLLLEDCTGATDYGNYLAALNMIKMQGGVFGSVAPSDHFLAALDAAL
ncbi:MAG: cysteine hydrolase, partial [Anaerolineae bacterium]|nr:cysteine hydrolase [Anaerolineae bacterium]